MDIAGQESKIHEEETRSKKVISERLLFKIGANINNLLTKLRYDIGDIQASVLNEVDFQNAHGNNWLQCNGQNAEATAYESLTGRSFVPDFRAEFLRQLNDTSIGRDKNRTLLTTQDSGNASHSHFMLSTGVNPNNNPLILDEFKDRGLGGSFYNYHSSSATPNAGITVDGDVDVPNSSIQGMLPANVAINYFIKVN